MALMNIILYCDVKITSLFMCDVVQIGKYICFTVPKLMYMVTIVQVACSFFLILS